MFKKNMDAPPPPPPPAAPAADSSDDESVWGEASADSGLACVEGRGDEEAVEHHGDTCEFGELARVFRAAEADATPEELARVIREVSRGCPERRREAVNYRERVPPIDRPDAPAAGWVVESALPRAHERRNWPLAGALVAAGADLPDDWAACWTPLAVCAAYGHVDGVREMLRAGHDAREITPEGSTAAHVALYAQLINCVSLPTIERRLACVALLAREGKCDLEARDGSGDTPLLKVSEGHMRILLRDALRLLVDDLGADVQAKNTRTGRTLLFGFVTGHPDNLSLLIDDYGLSADVIDNDGWSPLMLSTYHYPPTPFWQRALLLLLARSSDATRRAARTSDNCTAADLLLQFFAPRDALATPEWLRRAIVELLASGVPVQARFQDLACEIAAKPPPAAGGPGGLGAGGTAA